MKISGTLFCVVLAAAAARAQSDVQLDGDDLQRFLKTKGASHVGQDVRWYVPAKSFSVPRRERNGQLLFAQQGIGVIAAEGDAGLAEVRRRGGYAVVRGRVTAVPAKDRAPGDPAYVVVARSLSYRRQSAPRGAMRPGQRPGACGSTFVGEPQGVRAPRDSHCAR
jgi:hypothetical protein